MRLWRGACVDVAHARYAAQRCLGLAEHGVSGRHNLDAHAVIDKGFGQIEGQGAQGPNIRLVEREHPRASRYKLVGRRHVAEQRQCETPIAHLTLHLRVRRAAEPENSASRGVSHSALRAVGRAGATAGPCRARPGANRRSSLERARLSPVARFPSRRHRTEAAQAQVPA